MEVPGWMDYGFIVMLCFGKVFVVIGVVQMIRFTIGNRNGQDVTATVMSMRHAGAGQIIICHAAICYEVGGKSYSTEIRGSTLVLPGVGKTITIGIDPAKPDKVYLRRGKGYIAFFVLGGIFLVLTTILMQL